MIDNESTAWLKPALDKARKREAEQARFIEHLERAAKTVASWPAWKQNILGEVVPELTAEEKLFGIGRRLDRPEKIPCVAPPAFNLTCVDCGEAKPDVKHCVEPFQEQIYDREVTLTLCEDCYQKNCDRV